MAKQKVRVLINEDDKSRFEYMLEQLQFLIRDIEATPLELTHKNKDYICFITVIRHNHFELLIGILRTNGFGILTHDKKVQDVLTKLDKKSLDELPKIVSDIELKKKVNKDHPALDKLIADGNYSELAKVVRNITYSPETIMKALAGISRAVTNSIIKNIENVSKYKISVEMAVKNLLSIATDAELKYLNHSELMLLAATVAFEICAKDSDSITHLIKIANHKNMDYLINLKAAARFSEITLSDETRYKNQLKSATRELNVKWLVYLLDPLREKLTEEENNSIEKLISYVKKYFDNQ